MSALSLKMLKCVRKLCHSTLWSHKMQSCDLTPRAPGAYTIPLECEELFLFWVKLLLLLQSLVFLFFRRTQFSCFFVFWGIEKLSSVRSLFLIGHQSGLLENLENGGVYSFFHLFCSFSKPFFPACVLAFKEADGMGNNSQSFLSDWGALLSSSHGASHSSSCYCVQSFQRCCIFLNTDKILSCILIS